MGFEISSSNLVNKYQMILGDGIDKMFLTAHGGTGGKPTAWNVPQGEKIASIEYYYDKYVNALTFITNKGNKSPTFGSKVGKTAMVNIPADQRIIGDYGKSGDYVDQLGFFVGKTIIPTPKSDTSEGVSSPAYI